MPHAVVMTGYGPPEVLKWAHVPLPPDAVLGFEAAGTVDAHRQLENGNVHERIILTLS